uniref:Uncharacterized protein n=1 Tax=Tanacetum cinerariifolium TaxID=118510 RepID=A0A6L2LP61_TANCI|nr:hypothetical protein [Tanacetum cinerariifolium]
MGCIVSKTVPANKYVRKQPNKSGKELSGTSNTLLELYTEEYIAYGPESIERMLLRFLGLWRDCVYSWGALQLRSPPPFTIVHKHLKGVRLTESSFLAIEDAVVEVLQYLELIWNTLSSSDIRKLRELQFIPVGNSTYWVDPVCIYCHPKVDFFPLAFELPSRYQPFIKILKELGLHDMLSVSSAMSSLSGFHKYYGYERLCPNTLRGVIELLNFVFNETIDQQKSDGFNLESKLVVPDESCRLVHPNACVYIDPYGSQYVKYAESLKLTFVHHDVSERLCFAFGVLYPGRPRVVTGFL